MGFLNLGWSEILVIILVAFIVLGPDRITSFSHDLGSWLRKLNKNETFRDVVQTTDEIRNYPQKIMDEAMLDRPMNNKTHLPTEDFQPPNNSEEAPPSVGEDSGDKP
ncbi:MAG: twin-arginine translocase TatA/TatE family subunit [Anaerolineaceae bacterium]